MKRQERFVLLLTGWIDLLWFSYLLWWSNLSALSWQLWLIITASAVLGFTVGLIKNNLFSTASSFLGTSLGLLSLILPALSTWRLAALAFATLYPLNYLLANQVNGGLLRQRVFAHEMRTVTQEHPQIDLTTGALSDYYLQSAIERQTKLVRHHPESYRFSLTLVQIDFLENLEQFFGDRKFASFLRTFRQRLQSLLFTEDDLYYLGAGQFLIISPMLPKSGVPILISKLKQHVADLEHDFKLADHSLVVRMGSQSFAGTEDVEDQTYELILHRLRRQLETDITKEYF